MSTDDKNSATSFAEAHGKQELARIRAERARLQEQRDARALARQESDELAAESLALANELAIEKAECEHGPLGKAIAAVHTSIGVVIVKKPNHMIYKRFLDKGEADSAAFESLVRPSLVHPDKSTFDRYVEELPAILTQVADAVVVLAGAKVAGAQGKS